VFLGRDPEDMGNLVGPLLSLHHIPSARSKDSGHRFSVGVLLSVWVVNREDSQSADGNGVFFFDGLGRLSVVLVMLDLGGDRKVIGSTEDISNYSSIIL